MKFFPARRVMTEPLSQLRARREILGPVIDRGLLLLDAAWPQPIDQDARAVLPCGRIVSALQPNVICKNPRAHRYRSDLVGSKGWAANHVTGSLRHWPSWPGLTSSSAAMSASGLPLSITR